MLHRVIEQRVREAAKAARAGAAVRFVERDGGGDRKVVAVYGGQDHAIFTGGSGSAEFATLKATVLQRFQEMTQA